MWRALELVCSGGALAKEPQLGLQLPRTTTATSHVPPLAEEAGGTVGANAAAPGCTCPLSLLQADLGDAGSAALEPLLSAGWLELRVKGAKLPPCSSTGSLVEVSVGNSATDEAADALLGTGATVLGDAQVAVGCAPVVQGYCRDGAG